MEKVARDLPIESEPPRGRLLDSNSVCAEEDCGHTEFWRRVASREYDEIYRDGRKILIPWESILRRRKRFLKKAAVGARKGQRRYERKALEATVSPHTSHTQMSGSRQKKSRHEWQLGRQGKKYHDGNLRRSVT